MQSTVAGYAEKLLQISPVERLALCVAAQSTGRLRRFLAANRHLPEHVKVVHDRGAFTMVTGTPVCLVAQRIWLSGSLEYEAPIPRIVPALAKGRSSMVVGANSGYYAMLLAQNTGEAVTAYEPFPSALMRLRENLCDNGLNNVEVRPCAVGATPGRALLYLPQAHDEHWPLEGSASLDAGFKMHHSGSVEVDVVTLDDEQRANAVELILIDVEGFESEVLAGARALLRTARPFLVVEVSDGSLTDVSRQLADLDYVPFEIAPDGLRQQARLSVAVQTEVVIDSATRSRYWNMVLVPRERLAQLHQRLEGIVMVHTLNAH